MAISIVLGCRSKITAISLIVIVESFRISSLIFSEVFSALFRFVSVIVSVDFSVTFPSRRVSSTLSEYAPKCSLSSGSGHPFSFQPVLITIILYVLISPLESSRSSMKKQTISFQGPLAKRLYDTIYRQELGNDRELC